MKTIVHNSKILMLVGTYSNGKGTLYRCVMDELTGLVKEVTSYTGFNKIYDANIKGL
jgi:tRNA A37 threonylcarbamoyladenosine biosynthesis protein TsaE